MASPYYQNQNTFSVAVPTALGIDVLLEPLQVVQGDAYYIFDYHDILVQVAGPYAYPVLRYIWPGSGSGGGGTGTLTGVNCLTPINGGGTTGVVDVGLDLLGITGAYIADGTITADKIAAGATVSSLIVQYEGPETLVGNIELVAGTNIVLTSNVLTNTITIATNPGLVSAVTATLPLSVITTDGTADIDISLNVTTTNNGGAVALQAYGLAPILQSGAVYVNDIYSDGYISLNVPYTTITGGVTQPSSLYLKTIVNTDYVFSAFTNDDVLTTYLTDAGVLHTSNIKNFGNVETATFSLKTDPWTGIDLQKAFLTAGVTAAVDNFINLPFSYYNTLTLAQTDITDDPAPPDERLGYGQILGSPLFTPLLAFGTTELIPAIKLGLSGETEKDLAFAVHDRGSVDPTIALYTDGTITCNRVDANYETTRYVLLSAGNYLVTNYPNVNTFIIDSATGTSSITLPELNATSIDGMILTFKKYDITINPVVVASAVGQTIDYDQTQYVLRTYKQSHASSVSTGEPTLHTIKVMSVVKPATSQYFWISL